MYEIAKVTFNIYQIFHTQKDNITYFRARNIYLQLIWTKKRRDFNKWRFMAYDS